MQDADRKMVLVMQCRREQVALKKQLGNVTDIGTGLSIAIRFHPTTSFMNRCYCEKKNQTERGLVDANKSEPHSMDSTHTNAVE